MKIEELYPLLRQMYTDIHNKYYGIAVTNNKQYFKIVDITTVKDYLLSIDKYRFVIPVLDHLWLDLTLAKMLKTVYKNKDVKDVLNIRIDIAGGVTRDNLTYINGTVLNKQVPTNQTAHYTITQDNRLVTSYVGSRITKTMCIDITNKYIGLYNDYVIIYKATIEVLNDNRRYYNNVIRWLSTREVINHVFKLIYKDNLNITYPHTSRMLIRECLRQVRYTLDLDESCKPVIKVPISIIGYTTTNTSITREFGRLKYTAVYNGSLSNYKKYQKKQLVISKDIVTIELIRTDKE